MDIKKQSTNIEFINTIKEMKKACICLAIIIIMSSITACGRAVPDEPKESMVQNRPEFAAEARESDAEENEEEPEVEALEIETARIERLEPKESLEHLFDYLYPDKNNIEISLHESEDELYYKYSLIYSSGEFSCPRILYYSFSTEDGLYQEFALYEEIWATVLGEESYKEHTHNHFVNFWYINTQSKEIIPRWVYNDEAEEDAYSRIDNDEYEAISVKYAKDNE